jgi:hypothetical protein
LRHCHVNQGAGLGIEPRGSHVLNQIVMALVDALDSIWNLATHIFREGSRVQGPGSGVQGLGSGVRGPGTGVLGPGSWVLGPGSWVLGPGSWVLGPVKNRLLRQFNPNKKYSIKIFYQIFLGLLLSAIRRLGRTRSRTENTPRYDIGAPDPQSTDVNEN